VIDAVALLAAYDELRDRLPEVPANVRAERDGPLVRTVGWQRGGMIEYRDLAGLDGAALDELIARQVRIFAERGEWFEWKLHGHDLPADLPERLRAAGFVPEARETVVVALAGAVAAEPVLPAGIALRAVAGAADFERLARMHGSVWGGDHGWLREMLAARLALDPRSLSVYVAEAGGEVVAAAWVRFRADSSFATLHGGSTLPAWRGRGIYRALVAERARLAVERGYRHLLVDASDASRPILEGLGFVAITTTTPFIWTPPQSS
jgi:ribosomal protein S18 acetylase RimI-like enzyme